MNKTERRRVALEGLIKSLGRGGTATVAAKISKDASYVSRMLYPAGKDGKKGIGEDTWDLLVSAYPELDSNSDKKSQPVGLDAGRLALVLEIVEGAITDSRKRVPLAYKAQMMKRVYDGPHALSTDTAPAVRAALAGLLESFGTD